MALLALTVGVGCSARVVRVVSPGAVSPLAPEPSALIATGLVPDALNRVLKSRRIERVSIETPLIETSALEQVIAGGVLTGVNVTPTITSPTSATTYDAGTSATVDLSGTATSDQGINICTWANSLSGGSGTATGTTSWSASVALTVGSNVITVTCTSPLGTTGQDVITVTRSSGSLTCDDSTSTTTSAGLQTFLNTISTGGSVGDHRVLCMTANIALTSQVEWDPPNYVTLWGGGAVAQVGASGGITITDTYAHGDSCNDCASLQFVGVDGPFRLTGFTYDKNSGGTNKNSGTITVGGDTTGFRMDHITFDAVDSSDQIHWMAFGGCLYGLLDHMIFNLPNDLAWLHMVNGSCDDEAGNTVWTQATGFGGANFLYVEDSRWLVDGDPGTTQGTVTDCHSAGKYVIRFNTVTSSTIGQTHPTIHGADDRGCRGHEIYGNTTAVSTVGDDPAFALSATNSGPSLVWGNSIGASSVERMFQVYNCRVANCGYAHTAPPDNWGPCDGSSDWDGPNDACIDQPGRGVVEDLITGLFPNKVNSRTSTVEWPIQALEPIYEWLNTGTPTQTYLVNLDSSSVLETNREYYLYNTSTCVAGGACTAGVGSGTTLPTTCTTSSEAGGGVGFWDTDAGSWNTSSSNPEGSNKGGADGVLYKCTATDTWTPYYTPYTYPHPLNN